MKLIYKIMLIARAEGSTNQTGEEGKQTRQVSKGTQLVKIGRILK